MINSLIQLLYPEICAACGEPIHPGDDTVCHLCFSKMAFCPYKPGHTHPVEKIFWGRSRIEAATSLLVFSKHGIAQQLLHRLKYKGDQEVGIYLGKLLGYRIAENPGIRDADCLVPVPLFDKKKQARGYNQSEVLSNGIAESLQKPLLTNYLKRVENNSTQTKKGRLERVENVSKAFDLADIEIPKGQHVLLIDDVITTGSTLEACINLLAPFHKVSVATVAYQ